MNIILHMGDPYPNESPAAKRIRAFYDVLTQRGHHVTVMAPKYGGEQAIPDVVYCPTIEMKKKTTLMRMVNQLSFAVSSVFCSGRAGKADVVLTTSPPVLISQAGWLIAKMKGAKLVYDVRDIWPDVLSGEQWRISNPTIFQSGSDRFFTGSRHPASGIQQLAADIL